MISTEHDKRHGHLKRPSIGEFGRNEFAVYGTTCEGVERFYNALTLRFPDVFFGYADAMHHDEVSEAGGLRITVGTSSTQIHASNVLPYSTRQAMFSSCECVVINGNHFSASRQLIIPDASKEASLRKRADQLTRPLAIWLPAGTSEVPVWLGELVDLASLPVLREDVEADIAALRKLIITECALNALVLTGGRGVRMGSEKHTIGYHGKPHYIWTVEMLERKGMKVWISCRPDQSETFIQDGFSAIPDAIHGIGPLGAIASAFMYNPDSAWLVLASDMPAWNEEATSQLIGSRDPSKHATSFTVHNNFPEPLAAIWEPSSYVHLMQCLVLGIDCPRKVLINGRTSLVSPSDPLWLANANTPEERDRFLNK